MAEILMSVGVLVFFVYLEYSDRKRQAIADAIRHYQEMRIRIVRI